MKILSLFDGISTYQLAAARRGLRIRKYYAAEIKGAAIRVTQRHFPDTVQLGDVRDWHNWEIDWASIDLVLSGSPCQDLSNGGKRAGIYGTQSSLFFIFVDILNHIRKFNPGVWFLQENVASARPGDIAVITEALGVYPQLIDSRRYVPQRRKRLYWSNIRTYTDIFGQAHTHFRLSPGSYPMAESILTSGRPSVPVFQTLRERYVAANWYVSQDKFKIRVRKKPVPYVVESNEHWRILNRIELERLQGFPDGYTAGLTHRQAGSVLGDAWTLPVIEEFVENVKSRISKDKLQIGCSSIR